MSKYKPLYSNLWNDPDFENFTVEQKLIFIFLITNSGVEKSGIYKITNKITQKIYIGSSKNIRKRWKAHRTLLNREKHYNEHLLAAYKKYGKENFSWEVVEFIDVNNLEEREQYWIDFFGSSDRKKGYNLCPAAYSNLGLKHTDESRRNMSLAHLGHKHTSESKKKISQSQYKTVYQFDLKGNFIQKFNHKKERLG